MILLQLFHDETSTFTYLLADPSERAAVLIDPVLDHLDRYVTLLARLGLTLRTRSRPMYTPTTSRPVDCSARPSTARP